MLIVCFLAFELFQFLQSGMKKPYCVWHAAAMVIDYMKHHDNKWPGSWDDLRTTTPEPYESGGFQNFEEVQKRVQIDWTAKPSELVNAMFSDESEPPFKVIWLKDGSTSYVTGSEPNHLIWMYLQKVKHKLPQGAL